MPHRPILVCSASRSIFFTKNDAKITQDRETPLEVDSIASASYEFDKN